MKKRSRETERLGTQINEDGDKLSKTQSDRDETEMRPGSLHPLPGGGVLPLNLPLPPHCPPPSCSTSPVSIATFPDPEGKYCPGQKQRGCVDIISCWWTEGSREPRGQDGRAGEQRGSPLGPQRQLPPATTSRSRSNAPCPWEEPLRHSNLEPWLPPGGGGPSLKPIF